MTYEEVLQYLYHSLPMYQRIGQAAIKKDLTNTLLLSEQLGNPHKHFKSVHVAGTNGKGSSAHSIAAILQSAGYKTGLYTSPHLKDFTERIRVNGEPMPQQAVIQFVAQTKEMLERVQPSFFETTVVMAFDHFAREAVDIAVVEVGLGGRLDSTNIIQPLVSLITNIGYDHTDMLGDTLTKIAFEKGGIIKEGVPVVIGEKQAEILPVFQKLAEERHAPIYIAQDIYDVALLDNTQGINHLRVKQGETPLYEDLTLALHGSYQRRNLPGILQVVQLLKEQGFSIDKEEVMYGLAHVPSLTGLKGRWQQLSTSPLTICDTGHNEEAFRYLVAQLQSMSYNQLHMVFGFSGDKDIQKVLRLLPTDAHYYFCQAQVPRAMPAEQLKQSAETFGLSGNSYATVEEALNQARQQADTHDMIFVGGSTFVVAEIKEL